MAIIFRDDDETINPLLIDPDFDFIEIYYTFYNSKDTVRPTVTDLGITFTLNKIIHGDGTAGNPYQVGTFRDLFNVRNEPSAYYIQTADIDLGGVEWEPIESFTGSYNGNGYKITNINAPLFGTTTNAVLQKIGLTNARVTNGSGVLADNCFGGTVEQCYSTGSISGTKNIMGGLIGRIQDWVDEDNLNVNMRIRECFSTCNVTNNSTVESTSAEYGTGGLIGCVGYTFTVQEISRCYSSGKVTVAVDDELTNVGGMFGYVISTEPPNISSCYYDSQKSGYSDNKGTPKTTVEMKKKETYLNWDFTNIWAIEPDKNNGYPYLLYKASDDLFQPWTAPKMEASWWEGFKLPFNVLELDEDAPIAIQRNFKEIEHFINILGRTSGEIKDSIGQFAAAAGGESSEYPIEWLDEEEPDVPSTDSNFAGYLLGKEGHMGSIDASIKTDEFGGINEVWIARVIDRQGIVEIYDSDAPEHIFRTVAREFGLPIVNLGAEIVDVAIEFDGTYNQYGIFVSDAAPDLFWVERTSDEDIIYSVKWNGTGTPPEPIELARAYLGDLYGSSRDLDSSITV